MFMKEKYKQKKNVKKEEGKKGKREKRKKMRRDSLNPGVSGLSHFENDFLKF